MPARQKRSNFFVVAALAAAMLIPFPALAKVIKAAGNEFTHKAVTETRLRSQVEFLSGAQCAGRMMGSEGSEKAAEWIAEELSQRGVLPMGESWFHGFTTESGARGNNIIGFLPGTSKSSYMIVAAHYDGLGIREGKLYPGADSDASGVAGMLGVAAMMKEMVRIGKNYRKNIIFVALDGKFADLAGSKALWKMLCDGTLTNPQTGEAVKQEQVTLMVNIDQIGCTLSPLKSGRPDYLILLSNPASDYHRGSLRVMNEKYGIGLELGYDYYGSKDFTRLFYERVSDQRPFVENGRPAVMFTSGITLNNNKDRDTADTLDYTVMKKRIWLIFHWIERVI